MNNHRTEIIYLLDCSQAMRSHATRALAGFNRFLSEQQESADPIKLSLVLFSEQPRLHHNRVPIDNALPLDPHNALTHGRCALHDAIGITLNSLERKFATLPTNEQPAHVLIALCTTGEDNASRRFTLPAIQQKIHHQRTQRNWEFLLLAPTGTALLTANRLGIEHDSALSMGEIRSPLPIHRISPDYFSPPQSTPRRPRRNGR